MSAATAKAGRRKPAAGRTQCSVWWNRACDQPKSDFMSIGCSWLKSKAWVMTASLSADAGRWKSSAHQRENCSAAAK